MTLTRVPGLMVLGSIALLAGCGSATTLKPPKGQPLPVAPYGATATPTPAQELEAAARRRFRFAAPQLI